MKKKCKVYIEEMLCKGFDVEYEEGEDPTEIALKKYENGEFIVEDVVPTVINTMEEYPDGFCTSWQEHYNW